MIMIELVMAMHDGGDDENGHVGDDVDKDEFCERLFRTGNKRVNR